MDALAMSDANDKDAERKAKRLEAFRRESERSEEAAAKYLGEADQAADQRDEWHRRWSLRLAVANGAGMVGVCTVALNAYERLTNIGILPTLVLSAWLFFIGGALAGSIPLFRSRYFHHRHGWLWTYAQEQRQGGGTVSIWKDEHGHDVAPSSYHLKKHWRGSEFWTGFVTMVEITAALTFVVGIVAPLSVLTARVWFGIPGL